MKTIIDTIRENNELPRRRTKLDNGHEYEVEVSRTLRGWYTASLNEEIAGRLAHVVAVGYGSTQAEALNDLKTKCIAP
jgi:hypothetical protein